MTPSAGWPHRERVKVRYAEVDAQQVVFNAHYLTWCDVASSGWAEAAAGWTGVGDPVDWMVVRAVIQRRRDEMDRAAVNAYPFFESALVGVQAGEGRQQRGVNIHQATGVVADKTIGQDAHETGQNDQIRLETINALGQRRIEGGAPGKALVVNVMGDDSRLGGSFQALGIRSVTDHGSDVDRQVASIAGGDQRFHVAAAAGNQDDNILHFKKLTGKKTALTTPWVSREKVRPLQDPLVRLSDELIFVTTFVQLSVAVATPVAGG